MRVSVIQPEKIIYEGNAREVILPGETGEQAVLDFHQPFLCRLKSGWLRIKPSVWAGQAKGALNFYNRIAIKHGIAKMIKNELVIMVEPYA